MSVHNFKFVCFFHFVFTSNCRGDVTQSEVPLGVDLVGCGEQSALGMVGSGMDLLGRAWNLLMTAGC